MQKLPVKIKKLHPDAKTPIHASQDSAGFDLHTLEEITIHPKSTAVIPTGISWEIPRGYYVKLAGRSGLASKGITPLGGIIDADYRGEVKVILHNLSDHPHTLAKGDRIAQGIIMPVSQADFEETNTLSETQRNEGGFGSSGK